MQNSLFINNLMKHYRTKYLCARKEEKSRILNELVDLTKLHRKSLIRALNKQRSVPRGGSKSKYHPHVQSILELVCESKDFICAERIHPSIAECVESLEYFGHLKGYAKEAIAQVKAIPLGTLKLKIRGIKPLTNSQASRHLSTDLKKQVPIDTKHYKQTEGGHFEVDFVDHNGGDSSGRFARSLNFTDVHLQWVCRRATLGKDRASTVTAFESIVHTLLYTIKSLHSDNEPNLLYVLLGAHAKRKRIWISRSRSYQKNDNPHVEQKNGDKIRELVGYFRYDTVKSVDLLNQIYGLDDIYQNFFVPSMRLLQKEYDDKGRLRRKIYDKAKSPYARLMNDPTIDREVKAKLQKERSKLDPLELKRARDKMIRKLKTVR